MPTDSPPAAAQDSTVDYTGTFPATQNGPDTPARCDLEFCQECGLSMDPANMGYRVTERDVAGEGETHHLFKEDAEHFGDWQGFEEEDIGAWCDSCSWILQRRRTT